MTLGQNAGGWYVASSISIFPLAAAGLLVNDVTLVLNAMDKASGAVLAKSFALAENVPLSALPYPIAGPQRSIRWERLLNPVNDVPTLRTHHFSVHLHVNATNGSDARRVWLTLDVPTPMLMQCGHDCVAVGQVSVAAGATSRRKCDAYFVGTRWETTCMVSET